MRLMRLAERPHDLKLTVPPKVPSCGTQPAHIRLDQRRHTTRNILRVGVTESGRPYMVMPYYAADPLGIRLRREGPVLWPKALRIGVHLCGALETAHKTGALHRDIKPANVLVNDWGEPQLSDFGIAHIEGGFETAIGSFSGTIDYTAPEVITGNPATVAADICSLGATIYALIAGNAASRFDGDHCHRCWFRTHSRHVSRCLRNALHLALAPPTQWEPMTPVSTTSGPARPMAEPIGATSAINPASDLGQSTSPRPQSGSAGKMAFPTKQFLQILRIAGHEREGSLG
jgi:serine/threonine protein kinase